MPASKFEVDDPNQYLAGLNSYHESEAVEGALSRPQSLPQQHAQGLYHERISGTSFTAKRAVNKQTFLYRILPSTAQSGWARLSDHPLNQRPHHELNFVPDQIAWPPQEIEEKRTFLDGMRLIGAVGDPTTKNGVAYYFFTCGADMDSKQAFYSADGDMLIVPQLGALDVQTEMGELRVRPREICAVPRGIRFRVSLPNGPSRGHVIEPYSGHFDVPELGPIGSLGLANVRDFEIPKAKFNGVTDITEVIAKFGGKVHNTQMNGSAFNAVAWHGTYYPYKYDLGKFMPMGSTLYDHQDPSIYVVLTCPSDKPDHAAVDFLVLGPRWMVMEDTFQLPYFHRNTMSEFFSIISGGVDLSRVPEPMWGMSALNNTLSPHGVGVEEFEHAEKKKLVPERVPDDHMVFLVESCYPIGLSDWAFENSKKIHEGGKFGGFKRRFNSKI